MLFKCSNCEHNACRCAICDTYHMSEQIFKVFSEAPRAALFETINDELHKHGYSMLVPQNNSIAMLPNGAILVCHPDRKPISILINTVDPYGVREFKHGDDVS